MRNAKIFRQELKLALEMVGDEEFAKMGFKRRKGSLDYVRLIGDAKQVINFHGNCWPKHSSHAEFHIYPYMQIFMKSMRDMRDLIFDKNDNVNNKYRDMIVSQPMEFAAEKSARASWYVSGYTEIKKGVLESFIFCETWVIPIFDRMVNPSDIINFHKTQEKWQPRTENWYLNVIAAYLYKNDIKGAQNVLQENLGKLGQRMRHASVYEKLGLDPKLPK